MWRELSVRTHIFSAVKTARFFEDTGAIYSLPPPANTELSTLFLLLGGICTTQSIGWAQTAAQRLAEGK